MQKKIITTIGFLLAVGLLIGAGVWYDTKTQEKDNAMIAEQGAAVIAQQNAQQQAIMENFKITDITVGTGTEAQNGDTVSVLYSGSLDNGTVFDASSLHGNQPFSFTLGVGQVIKGWDLGVVGMRVGGKRELTIPPQLGYGANPPIGSSIPPNATLHFTVELLSVSTSSAAGQ
jgi:FKBP-type peptidyl-prolyl cis-trans isomerase